MPRIRKKTSSRQNTRDRAKITKKVSEHKKKTKKAAKKDVTWKSKKPVDAGVPNSFPYKDRVLAELAEEKRRNEEEKQARKEANKQKLDEPEEDTPGIFSLAGSSVLSGSAPIRIVEAEEEEEEDEAEIPELIDTSLATLQDVLDKADVVVQVLDARDIQGGRSGWVEKLVKDAGGRYALAVNKIDLAPRETLAAWLPHLPADTYLISSSPVGPSASPYPGRSELLAAFKKWSSAKKTEGELTVAFMGLPNVGKTSLLNALLPASAQQHPVAPVLPTAAASKNPQPTTSKPVEVLVNAGDGLKVRVIDTPGWEYADEEIEDEEMEEEDFDEMEEKVTGDMLRRNLGRIDRVKDVLPLANYIIKRSNAQDLMLAYNIPYFTAGDVEAFLLAVARANGRIRKHGDVDMEGAARIILRDWATNTFPYVSTAPKSTAAAVTGQADMTAVLAACRSRKEMRATGKGLIKFQGGDVDSREVILDDDFIAMAGPSDDEDEDDDDEELDEEELDDDEDAEEDLEALILSAEDGDEVELEDGPEPSSGSDVEEEEEDEEESEDSEEEDEEIIEKSPTPPPVAQKRKRKSDIAPVTAASAKKAKRVSFGQNEIRVMEAQPSRGKGSKRKR